MKYIDTVVAALLWFFGGINFAVLYPPSDPSFGVSANLYITVALAVTLTAMRLFKLND